MTTRILTVVFCLSIAACATNPVTGNRELSLMSEAEEIAYGQQADAEIRREMGVYDDPAVQRYVADIGHRLAQLSHRPHLPWTFTVVDHPAINAFALPGGYIYITRGILPYLDNEAELAGVLGHEIAHVTARHAAQQLTRSGLGGIGLAVLSIFVPATRPFGDVTSAALGVAFLKYGRDDERESDRLGMEYAARGGWDPAGVPNFLATLARIDEMSARGIPNWLSTHPEPAERVVEAQPVVKKFASESATETGRDRYFEHIDELVVGDNPQDGIVRGHRFLHPVLRFALEFPEGWEVTNTPDQVAAQEPGQKHFMLLQLVDRPTGRTLEEVAVRSMSGARFKRVEGQMTSLNGADAYVGVYQGQLSGLGRVLMRAAHIQHGRQVFLLAGFAPEPDFARVERDVAAAIQSYRPLTQREADQIRPNRLDFYVVRAGDSWQSIAARGGNLVRANDLAIMNNHAVHEQPEPGLRIKIVVEG
ncbi:MAG TPA: M48 family metalloprotease [Vicinamibacterales bacterium]|nr:M48 family metalloprotease [Vicinamibacterales bacterium]